MNFRAKRQFHVSLEKESFMKIREKINFIQNYLKVENFSNIVLIVETKATKPNIPTCIFTVYENNFILHNLHLRIVHQFKLF